MKKFLAEFKEFAMKGNVLDMAIGIIVGAAFTSIVNSLVDDIISPVIATAREGQLQRSGSISVWCGSEIWILYHGDH